MSCWLIIVDTYSLMPSGTQNHTIPTMHRGHIFLCQNVLSEQAFELCSDAKSITPSFKTLFWFAICNFRSNSIANLWQTFKEFFESYIFIKGENMERKRGKVLYIIWRAVRIVKLGMDLSFYLHGQWLKQMAAVRPEAHSIINTLSVLYYCPYQINLKLTHCCKTHTSLY